MQSKNNALGFLGILLIVVGLLVWAIRLEMSPYSVAPMVIGGILLLVYVFMNIGFLSEKLTGRKAVEGANMGISIVIFLAIVVFLNMLFDKYSTRFDYTEAKKYSLASQTIQLIEGLEQPIDLLYLQNPNSPGATQRDKELLDLYVFYSDNLNYEVVDPEREPQKVEELAPVTLGAVYARKGNQHEKVSPVDENNLTNAILKLVKGGEKIAYFTSGHGEHSIESEERDGMNFMKQLLEEEGYQAKDLQLFTMENVPDDANVVIIAGPKKPFFETEIEAIKEYLQYGGSLFAMLDPETKTGLEQFFQENYGVTFGNDYIVENNPLQQIFGGSPIIPLIGEFGSHEIVNQYGNSIPAIQFPIVQSLQLAENPPDGVEGTEIIKTGASSWAERDVGRLKQQGEANMDEGVDLKGPVPIAVALTKPAEEKVSEATGEEETEETTDETDSNVEELEQEPEARLVLFGDSDFATNRMYRSSMDLFLNSVNWLAGQEDLISIRPKEDAGQPIFVSPVQANLLFYTSLIILPGCVALFGIVISVRKRLRG